MPEIVGDDLIPIDTITIIGVNRMLKNGNVIYDKETRDMGIAAYDCKYYEQPDGTLRVYINRYHGNVSKGEGPIILRREQVRDV